MLEDLWLLGFWRESIWGFGSLWEVLTLIIFGLALIFLGHVIKGVLGALTAFGLEIGSYLYAKGLLSY